MTITGLCRCANVSKQAFYKGKARARERDEQEEKVLSHVRVLRQRHTRMGTRKLKVMLDPVLANENIAIGRNRLFALLGRHGLLVKRRRNGARTTDSRHHMKVYRNALRDAAITAPNQALVSDLTYLRTREGFAYAVFVMDAFSRKIVGWDVAASLEASGCLRAARAALAQLPQGAAPIHHSDRGTQYCCGDYIALLKEHGATISMTEENHCYENAKAERLNGIMKQEYGLGEVLADLAEAKRLGAQAVLLYNNERPHTALGYATPEAIHHQPLAPDPQAIKGTPPGAPPQTPGFIAKRPNGWRGRTEGKGSR